MRSALVFGLLGCGRIGFAPIDDRVGDAAATDDAAMIDGRPIDAPANAVTVSFGDRGDATFQATASDTYISNEAGEPTLNYGFSDELRSEQDVDERILLRFDVDTIPPTATVFQVQLSITVTEANTVATWFVHPVLEQWSEGTADGTAGAANFTQRMPGTAWAVVGAGMPGSSGLAFATIKPNALGTINATLPNAPVQNWVTNPATNFGMIFLNDDTNTARFAASENATPAMRPLLTVTYVP
ncbi:MAG TPA: DNRLRE domain-containing protein [Kofleriaceae bacterium]|nr:DNRLRE domain-containing protein [Kofleriaceae bacterium]